MSVPIYNDFEKQLDEITQARWDIHYLTHEAKVKERSTLLQYKIIGTKFGALLSRVCKLLHLDYFECVRKIFLCADLLAAEKIIKATIILVSGSDLTSTLTRDQKEALFNRVAAKFNTLINKVNSKKREGEKLPPSALINVATLMVTLPKQNEEPKSSETQNTNQALVVTQTAVEPVKISTSSEMQDAKSTTEAQNKKRVKGHKKGNSPEGAAVRRSARLAAKLVA